MVSDTSFFFSLQGLGYINRCQDVLINSVLIPESYLFLKLIKPVDRRGLRGLDLVRT